MSIRSIAGAVVGGVIGFFVGGLWGAFYGASIGFGLGMAVDPLTPDISSPGVPLQELQFTGNTIGTPIADVLGTVKLVGTFLCYGKERVENITQETGGKGGGGGGEEQVTGHRYYMSWVQGICKGPVDTLFAIYKDNDELLWSGELNRPASGGQETILLADTGSMTFYFGTDDQAVNSKIGEIISDNTLNSPLRGLCYAFFDDCYIGDYNRCPTLKFVLKKIPSLSFSTENVIQTYNYNPAHAIWYILAYMVGLPEAYLDSVDFANIASELSGEGRGTSILFSQHQSALTYLESINSHIDNIIRYGSDGKFHPKLIRDDYVVDNLLSIDENMILEEPSFNRNSWIDTINEMKVQYSQIYRGQGEKQGEDDFTDVDGTSLIEHGVNVGVNWVDVANEIKMESNKADADFNSVTPTAYIDEAEQKDGWVQAKFVGNPYTAGVFLRYNTGTKEKYSLELHSDGKIYIKGDSDFILIDDLYKSGDVYRLEVYGGALSAFRDGKEIKTLFVANLTQGKSGFMICDRPKCEDESIGYTTQQMTVNETQTLNVQNAKPGKPYTWTLEGGGSLNVYEGTSVIYTAPSTNPNCNSNPTIIMWVEDEQCDALVIAVTAITGSDNMAYSKYSDTYFSFSVLCDAFIDREKYRCDDVLLEAHRCEYQCAGTFYCERPCSVTSCGSCAEKCWVNCRFRSTDVQGINDYRSEADKAAGCCPAGLL